MGWAKGSDRNSDDDDVYPICCGDSGGRAGFLTKPHKIEEVQIL